MNPLLTALNGNGGAARGSRPPLSTQAWAGSEATQEGGSGTRWGGRGEKDWRGECESAAFPALFSLVPKLPLADSVSTPGSLAVETTACPWPWSLCLHPPTTLPFRGSWVTRSREQGGEWGAEVTVPRDRRRWRERARQEQGSEGPSVVSRRHRRKGWWKCPGDSGVQGWGGLQRAAHFRRTHISGPSWGKALKHRSLSPRLSLPWFQQTTWSRLSPGAWLTLPVPGLPQGRDNTSRLQLVQAQI